MMRAQDNFKDRLTKGAFALTAATLVVKLLGLIYKIPLSYILSEEGLGYFNTAYTVYSLFYVVSVSGVPKAISILVPMENNESAGFALYKAAHRSFLAIGCGLSLFLLIFSFFISDLIGAGRAAFSLIAVAPSILLTATIGVMRGFLNAKFSYREIACSHIIEALVKLVFGIALSYLGVYLGLDVALCSALGIFGVTLGCAVTYLYLLIMIKSHKVDEKAGQRSSKSVLKRILKISFPITLSASVMSLSGIIDLFLVINGLKLSGMSQVEAAGVFGSYTTFVVPLISLANAIISPIAISFIPFISAAHKKGDMDSLADHARTALINCAFISVPIFFGLSFYSCDVLTFLFKDSSAYGCAQLLSISAPTVLLTTYFTVIATVLEACGHVKAPIIAVLFGSLAKILVSALLIGNGYGILGAAIGTLVCYGLASVTVTFIYFNDFRLFVPVIDAYSLPFVRSSVMILISSILFKVFSLTRGEALSTLFLILSCVFVYFGLALLGAFITKKRINIRQNAQKNII